MGSFNIEVLKSADRDIRKVDKQRISDIFKAIHKLSNDPFPQNSKKLKGSASGYRLRVGDYRVLYEVDTNASVVTIYYIRHRKDAYRK